MVVGIERLGFAVDAEKMRSMLDQAAARQNELQGVLRTRFGIPTLNPDSTDTNCARRSSPSGRQFQTPTRKRSPLLTMNLVADSARVSRHSEARGYYHRPPEARAG